MYGISCEIVSWFGVERSMWHRHTQPLAFSGTRLKRPAGCGSWIRHTSQPSLNSRAFISLKRFQVAHCSESRS